ncbi:MAG TPA: hypothetical protein VHK69_19460 [Chitinophagaceae bacterium]|jgi:hypothetical protein|nr:hypothetical protein [Chitinophagaceae bacterium]
MKKLLLPLILVASLTACQKENDDDVPAAGSLLTRIQQKSGTDSSDVTFTYDTDRRVTGLVTQVPDDNGNLTPATVAITRNGQGVISKVSVESDALAPLGITRLEGLVNYDANTRQYKSRVTKVNIFLFVIKDSTVFTYDNGGKIVREDSYTDDGFSGTGYAHTGYTEYTYAGNNLASARGYTVDGTDVTEEERVTYTYDNKTNPIALGPEAIVIQLSQYTSANNITRQEVIVPIDPDENQTITTTYTYNNQNLPVSAQSTVDPGGETVQVTYFYQ